jgi:hypothetical protein
MLRSAASFLANGVANTRPPDDLTGAGVAAGVGGVGGGGWWTTGAGVGAAGGGGGGGVASTLGCSVIAPAPVSSLGLKLANAAMSFLSLTTIHSNFKQSQN